MGLSVRRWTSPTFLMATAALHHPESDTLTTAPGNGPQLLRACGDARRSALTLTLLPLLELLVWGTEPDLPILVVELGCFGRPSLARIASFRANELAARLETAVADIGRQLLEVQDPNDLAIGVARAIDLVIEDAPLCGHGRWRAPRTAGSSDVISIGGRSTSFSSGRSRRRICTTLRASGAITRHSSMCPSATTDDSGRSSQPARNRESTPLGLQTVAAQITQALATLKLAEARFSQRAEQRLHALVEQSSDLVTVLGSDGTMAFVSPNAHRVLGSTPTALIGTPALTLVHPDDERAARNLLRTPTKPFETPRATEIRLTTADGDYRWFDATARDFRDDPEVGGVVVTARDITEERAAKLGLLRSEQWFRGLVQNSSDIIAVLDDAGVFTYASPAVADLTGLKPRELQGRNFLELLPATTRVPRASPSGNPVPDAQPASPRTSGRTSRRDPSDGRGHDHRSPKRPVGAWSRAQHP